MKKTAAGITAALFIVSEAAVFTVYTVMDIAKTADSRYFKYAGILICVAFSLLFAARGGRDERITAAALLLTAAADAFLLLADSLYAVGVGLFCAVQVLYFARLCPGRRRFAVQTALRLLLFAAGLLLLYIVNMLTVINALCALSFTLLLVNTVTAFVSGAHGGGGARMLAAGLLLFLLCDMCVGLSNAGSVGLSLPYPLLYAARLGMWTFYLPSQLLIVLSCGAKND